MNNKSEVLKPSNYIFGILAFTFVIMAVTFIFMEFKRADSTVATEPEFTQFNATFNTYQTVISKTSSLQNSTSIGGGSDFLNALVGGSWVTLSVLGTSWSFMNTVYQGMETIFGVPGWIPALIIAAIAIMFVFTLFSAIFLREL
jgi:hypothetical protein